MEAGKEGAHQALRVAFQHRSVEVDWPVNTFHVGHQTERNGDRADQREVRELVDDLLGEPPLLERGPYPDPPFKVRPDMGVDQPVHSVVVGSGLVHDQSAEFRPLRREEHQTEHPLPELVDGIVEGALGFEEAAELGEEVVDHRPPERLLGGEVVIDLRLMRSGADRNRSGRRASEAVSSELDGRGVDQLAADIDLSVVTSDIDDTISAIAHVGDFTAR